MDVKLFLYYLFIFTGAFFSAAEGYFVGKKKGLPSKPLKIYIALALTLGIFGAVLMGQIQNFVMSLTGLPYYISRMRIFGGLLFTPLLMYFPVKYTAGDFSLVSDIIAPGAYLILGFSKIGCAIYGCCYGTECSFGVTTPFEKHTVFPVQLLESLLCFILFGVMFYIVTKNKHRKGEAYPTVLILYGAIRFFVEFLRYYPEAEKTYFFGISFWQMVSVLTVLVGGIWLICKCVEKNRGSQNMLPPCEE